VSRSTRSLLTGLFDLAMAVSVTAIIVVGYLTLIAEPPEGQHELDCRTVMQTSTDPTLDGITSTSCS